MRRALFSALSVFLLVGPAGCASQSSVQKAPLHAGTSRTFEAAFERTLQVARESVVETGLQIEKVEKVNDENWMIMGHKPVSGFSWGEYVRVLVTKVDDAQTAVRVLTKKRLGTNVTAKGDYSVSILSNIELKLMGG
jgi:hypothetical protein